MYYESFTAWPQGLQILVETDPRLQGVSWIEGELVSFMEEARKLSGLTILSAKNAPANVVFRISPFWVNKYPRLLDDASSAKIGDWVEVATIGRSVDYTDLGAGTKVANFFSPSPVFKLPSLQKSILAGENFWPSLVFIDGKLQSVDCKTEVVRTHAHTGVAAVVDISLFQVVTHEQKQDASSIWSVNTDLMDAVSRDATQKCIYNGILSLYGFYVSTDLRARVVRENVLSTLEWIGISPNQPFE